jgi:hypothetical protein
MASVHVTVRLDHGTWKRYSAQAEARGVALGTYLRRRLELQDQALAAELDRPARGSDPAQPEKANPMPPPVAAGTLVELLYLLRTIAGPQKSAMASSEVARRGLESWK